MFSCGQVADFGGPTINAAYCIDFTQDLTQKVVTSANLMVATEANALAVGVSAAGAANMDSVNWILNQNFTAQDNGDDNVKAQANAMMGSMDTAMPAIWWRLRISNCT